MFNGGVWLHEVLHWQGHAAVVVMSAIASVLCPAHQGTPSKSLTAATSSLFAGKGMPGLSHKREMPGTKNETRVDPHAECCRSA